MPPTEFTLVVSIVILGLIGLAMLVANLFGVPVSTSMTAVGAIAGLGLARGSLNLAVMGGIVSWWLLAPIIGFWCGAVLGRYVYAPPLREVGDRPERRTASRGESLGNGPPPTTRPRDSAA